jgi:hypothetical protein
VNGFLNAWFGHGPYERAVNVALILALLWVWPGVFGKVPWNRTVWYATLSVCGALLVPSAILVDHNLGEAVSYAFFAAIYAWLWWITGGGKWLRRKLSALGAKAKATLAKMKRKMAERPARPVLRPVPQGV